jgi:hypothetical protein
MAETAGETPQFDCHGHFFRVARQVGVPPKGVTGARSLKRGLASTVVTPARALVVSSLLALVAAVSYARVGLDWLRSGACPTAGAGAGRCKRATAPLAPGLGVRERLPGANPRLHPGYRQAGGRS